MRKKLLAKNTYSSLIAQVSALICGFILPRFFLQYFGSEVNGLVNSITQFLGIISFLELGMGAVVQSSLYKPLANSDNKQISRVMASANKFFRRLAQILLIYILFLVIVYPRFVNKNFGYMYTVALILAISISSFAQYYFGIVNSLLLSADQHGYIQYNAQTITIILNTVVCVILIYIGESVQLVKLASSLIFLARPLVLRWYVNKKYKIDWNIKYTEEPIKQKWNGVAQHVAAVVLDGTDTIVLTMFSTLTNVSIYSVYFLVIKGVKTLFLSMTNGIQSLIGELWAKQELKQLKEFFGWVEWCIHTCTTLIFACTAALIVPFIKVYTHNIHDANYIQPMFAVLLTVANAMHCLRLPYNIMVLAAGDYRQTQKNYIVAAILNIIISILAVNKFGLIGVTIGTLIAMSYQTIWLAIYNSRHFIFWSINKFIKQILIDVITFSLIFSSSFIFNYEVTNYMVWFLLAVKEIVISFIIVVIVNYIAYKEMINSLLKKIKCKKE